MLIKRAKITFLFQSSAKLIVVHSLASSVFMSFVYNEEELLNHAVILLSVLEVASYCFTGNYFFLFVAPVPSSQPQEWDNLI